MQPAALLPSRSGWGWLIYDELIGMCGRVTGTTPRNNLVLIEAVPLGWWYSAGLADGSVVATFQTDPDLTDASPRRTSTWRQQLQEARVTAARIAPGVQIDEIYVRTAQTHGSMKPRATADLQ